MAILPSRLSDLPIDHEDCAQVKTVVVNDRGEVGEDLRRKQCIVMSVCTDPNVISLYASHHIINHLSSSQARLTAQDPAVPFAPQV